MAGGASVVISTERAARPASTTNELLTSISAALSAATTEKESELKQKEIELRERDITLREMDLEERKQHRRQKEIELERTKEKSIRPTSIPTPRHD